MIKRLVVELTEALCNCPPGTLLALDIETVNPVQEDNCYDFQIVCTNCKTYMSTPINKLRALIRIENDSDVQSSNVYSKASKAIKPKLVLIQGGGQSSPSPNLPDAS